MNPIVRLRARLALLLGAAEIHLRLRLPRLTWALTRRSHHPARPFDELVRIESDPAYRALFFAELDAALGERLAAHTAALEEIEATADRLRDKDGRPGSAVRARWKGSGHARLTPLPWCSARDPLDEACELFAAHPSAHSWGVTDPTDEAITHSLAHRHPHLSPEYWGEDGK